MKRSSRPLCIAVQLLCLAVLTWTAAASAEELVKPAAAQDASQVATIFAGSIPTSLADLQAMEKWQLKLVERVLPCTVGVRVGQAQGSGVIVSADGYVLTAAHVSGEPNRTATFVLSDGRLVRGRTLGLSRTLDAGLMKINTIVRDGMEVEWPHAEIGVSGPLKPGSWCLATGHPGGYKQDRAPVVRLGRVLSKQDSLLITDCKLVGGDSGGPLFDMNGKVIGIHSRIGSALTTNMHVPVDVYMESWDRLVKGEEWGNLPGTRPILGVRGDSDSDAARITHVFPGSPADKAGLQVDDVILRFNNKEVGNFESLQEMVAEQKPGRKVKVGVQRDGKTIELTVTIGKLGGRSGGR